MSGEGGCELVRQIVEVIMDGHLALPTAQDTGSDHWTEGHEFGDGHVVAADDDFLPGGFDLRDELRKVCLCLVNTDGHSTSLVRSDQNYCRVNTGAGISRSWRWLGVVVTQEAQSLPEAVVYWRPGCPFCSMLRADLAQEGIAYRGVNIWDDPDAAAFVRSVARGHETVPTVTVGSIALVNPSIGEVAALLAT